MTRYMPEEITFTVLMMALYVVWLIIIREVATVLWSLGIATMPVWWWA